jgi:AcrR family transcriptional regulator
MTKRGRGENRDARRAERREELLDAAVAVIRREGSSASMEQIAAEAGVTKPIVYRHFRDRGDLVQAMAHRFATGLTEELAASLNQAGDPRQIMAATIDAYLAFVERDPELYRFVIQEVAPAPAAAAELSSFMREVGAQVAVVLGEQLRAAGADSGGAEPIAHGIVGMVHSAGDWWLQSRSMPRSRLVEYLTSLLWTGVAGLGLPAQVTPIAHFEQRRQAT